MTRLGLLGTISSVIVIAAGVLVAVPVPAYASSDRDHDGMSDSWEVHFRLNSRHANAFSDADHDGLTNIAEFRLGTNPRDRDSDDDGRIDGLEDRDHDGIANEDERLNACTGGGEGDEDECLVGAFSSSGEDD